MFYKHWKKIALALTGFFWTSCEDTVTSTAPEYGCPDDVCKQGPIDDSSSSNDGSITSSSSETSSSSSSDIAMSMPLYGVVEKFIVCEGDSVVKCDDGVTCVAKDSITGYGGLPCSPMETEDGLVEICPDYGIVAIHEKTYTCDDGNVYNEAEFLARYNRKNTVKPTSSSSSDIIPADTLYGVIEPKDDTLDAPIAVYGSPCYFDGTCRDEEK